MSERKTVAFIGAGAMASSLIRGIIAAGLYDAKEIMAMDISAAQRSSAHAQLGVEVTDSHRQAMNFGDVIVLAVKPQHMADVLATMREHVRDTHLIISIAAGVRIATIQDAIGPNVPIVRVMPNTPCLVGQAAAGLSCGAQVAKDDEDVAVDILESVGQVHVLPESLLDAVTGLSGSGPAYVYMMIEALADGGVAVGLPRKVALNLAAQTVLGAATMVVETQRHPGQLKDEVTSPAGTTAAGLRVLEKSAWRSAIIEAVAAAAQRSRELGEGK